MDASSVGVVIFGSASRLIFRGCWIGRLGDDTQPAPAYLEVVHIRLARLRRLRRLQPDALTLDRVLAVLLTVAAQIEIWLGSGAAHHRVATAVVAAVVTASVAVRRRYPTLVGSGVPVFAAVNFALWGGPQVLEYPIANFCALYALAVWTPPRRFAFGTALVVAGFLATSVAPRSGLRSALPFTVVVLVVMLLVRRVVGDRERRAQLAERRAQLAERENDLAAREAVVEERARIARELHDAIAHNVSMIVIQAGAERRVLHGEHGSTREVLQTIEQIGRSGLTEMRRLVGMLRSDAADPLAPQPCLRDLPTLVTQVSEAGLPVELSVDGARRDLPVGIELSAYRIVQEALTNALKHAGQARASVHVRYGPDTLELEIIDDGGGSPAPVSRGGHGLVGMGERVALFGGRFDAGRVPSGGFAVRVLLPIR
ncbi:MAG: sensor histidine kinase [Jatrophihabitans sp.]